MLISKINNDYFMNATHPKRRGFGHSRKKTEFETVRNVRQNNIDDNFVDMSDRELYAAASVLPNEKFNKIRNNVAGTLIAGVPVFDTIAGGMVQKGGLSKKAAKMAGRAGIWGLVLATSLSLGLVKHNANKHSVVLNNINENHPVMRFCMDAAYIMGVMTTALTLKNKVGSVLNKKFGQQIAKIKNPVKNLLDNSNLNKKFVLKLDNVVTKVAKGNRAPLEIAAAYTAPVLGGAAIVRYCAEERTRKKNIDTNFNALKLIQTLLKSNEQKNI